MTDKDESDADKPLLLMDVADPETTFLDTGDTPTYKDRPDTAYPFKKWMDSFRARKHAPSPLPERYVEGWSDSSQTGSSSQNLTPHHVLQEQQWERLSGHSSQLGTVKTTTFSIASQSIARSRGTTQSTANQSTVSDVRISVESSRPTSSHIVDEAAELRANKRRQVLREIVATESDYVLGLKALTGILSIVNTRPEIYHNIQCIRGMHERFLAQIQATTPSSATSIGEPGLSDAISRGVAKRLSGIDIPGLKNHSLRTRNFRATVKQRLKALAAEPLEALEVAREIDRLSMFFSAYEEFCSNYELLTQDVALLRRSIPNWAVFDQGIEALSKSVTSMESRKQEEKRSMSLNDLLIKPIQRVCKYPLLLQDLLRHTPVSDCPSSHDAISQILENIRTLVARINSATGNPVNRDRIHKTIQLQEKVKFSELHALQDIYQELGPMILCGVLHVVFQVPEQTTGEFMLCILFNCYFLLAKGIDDLRRLEGVACIYVGDLKMDTLQNGRGLYCYGCPFSWKIIFQDQDESYEFVLSASSATEEKQWKTETLKASAALTERAKPGAWEARKYSFVNLALVPLDRVQYASATLPRRSSMDSMAISRKYNVQPVLIKKTHCPHISDESTSQMDGEIERPKTPLSRTAVVVTARRVDRIRLERLTADVYTRDVLPLPGMVLGRGDLFRRGTIMRRLSLHTGFTRRSSSVSTIHSRPGVADGEASFEEEKEAISGDGCDDSADCESPKTPTSTLGRSRTLRFKSGPKGLSSYSSTSSPRSEKRRYQEGNLETSPSRKKWTSPMSLLSVLSPKNLIRPRSSMGQSTEDW